MSNQHISSAFDRELEAIQAQIMKMGGMVEAAILDALRQEHGKTHRGSFRAARSDRQSKRAAPHG